MSKKTKHVHGVLTEVVGTNKELSEFERFLNLSPPSPSDDLTKLTQTYRNSYTKIKPTIDKLALLEEIILQLRSKENLQEIKLSIVRDDYIYARSPFYRKGGSTKDLRVIVGKIEIDGKDLKKLSMDFGFMDRASKGIVKAMNKIIEENKEELKRIW